MQSNYDYQHLTTVEVLKLSEAYLRQAIYTLYPDIIFSGPVSKAKLLTQFVVLRQRLSNYPNPYVLSQDVQLYKQTVATIQSNVRLLDASINTVAAQQMPYPDALYLPIQIRAALTCRYNKLLLLFARQRLCGDDFTNTVYQLIKTQIQIEKIADLEKAATAEIDYALRALQQEKQQQLYKASKVDDLFDDDEQVMPEVAHSNVHIGYVAEFQQQVAAASQRIKASRLNDNLAVLELKEDVGDKPIERHYVDQLTEAALEYEDENDTKLSKRKMKELKKGLAQRIEDGMLEKDILKGIGDLAPRKKDE